MKRYPLGVQTFEKIINKQQLYIDKTKEIHRLIQSGGYYFYTRPRRFGKSLMLSTIKSILWSFQIGRFMLKVISY